MSVYFIRVGGYFKIGASGDPQRRCERLHKGGTRYTFPADVPFTAERELYRVVGGWKDEERCIRLALDHFAVGLEWFLDEPPVREFIDSLPTDRLVGPELPTLRRDGGFCSAQYLAVQAGRADREMARAFKVA